MVETNPVPSGLSNNVVPVLLRFRRSFVILYATYRFRMKTSLLSVDFVTWGTSQHATIIAFVV